MTECERIVKSGFVRDDFLKEEKRDGYAISVEMKKVWAIELDLLVKFISLCESHGLRYWCGDGTLLGAVRHKGFIPWDDDMDVWMPREDYDKLLDIAKTEVAAPYFFQTTETDIDYYCAFARLRNSKTTGVLVSKDNKCNNGIYIDIYPIDGLNENALLQRIRSFKVHINNIMANAYLYNINPSVITRVLSKFLHFGFIKFDYHKIYKRVNYLTSKVSWAETTKVGHIAFTERPYKKLYYNKSDFETTLEVPFEHIVVRIPAGYDHILSTLYGDYRTFPPIKERGLWHDFSFDPDMPYNEKKE